MSSGRELRNIRTRSAARLRLPLNCLPTKRRRLESKAKRNEAPSEANEPAEAKPQAALGAEIEENQADSSTREVGEIKVEPSADFVNGVSSTEPNKHASGGALAEANAELRETTQLIAAAMPDSDSCHNCDDITPTNVKVETAINAKQLEDTTASSSNSSVALANILATESNSEADENDDERQMRELEMAACNEPEAGLHGGEDLDGEEEAEEEGEEEEGDADGLMDCDFDAEANEAMLNFFSCQHCNKFFWTENSLKHHSSMCHSEKSFTCEICGKGFRFRSNLAEHRSVHTSIKPYVCKYCGKSSRLKGNLTKHILKHHKQETNASVGKEDIIIKKGKKSIKDPKAIDFLEKSMIVLTAQGTSSPMHHQQKLVSASGAPISPHHQRSSVRRTDAEVRGLSCASRALPTAEAHRSDKFSPPSHKNAANMLQFDPATKHASSSSAATSQSVQNSVEAIIEKARIASNASLLLSSLAAPSFQGANSQSKQHAKHAAKANPFAEGQLPVENFGACDTAWLVENARNYFDRLARANEKLSADDNMGEFDDDNEDDIDEHSTTCQKTQSPPKTQCEFCGKHFRKSAGLDLHLKLCHSSETFAHELQTATTVEEVKKLQQMDKFAPASECKPCATSSSSVKRIEQHLTASTATVSDLHCSRNSHQAGNGILPPTHQPSIHSFSATKPTVGGQSQRTVNAQAVVEGMADVNAAAAATTNGNHFQERLSNLASCQKDIRDIKSLLQSLQQSAANGNATKADAVLASLDSRIARVERQMEATLNTLGNLVKMQTTMNSALQQFRLDMNLKMQSLFGEIRALSTQHANHHHAPKLQR